LIDLSGSMQEETWRENGEWRIWRYFTHVIAVAISAR
jgi:hypothetical protein